MNIEDPILYTLCIGGYSDKQTTKLSVPFSPLMYRLDTKLTIDSYLHVRGAGVVLGAGGVAATAQVPLVE